MNRRGCALRRWAGQAVARSFSEDGSWCFSHMKDWPRPGIGAWHFSSFEPAGTHFLLLAACFGFWVERCHCDRECWAFPHCRMRKGGYPGGQNLICTTALNGAGNSLRPCISRVKLLKNFITWGGGLCLNNSLGMLTHSGALVFWGLFYIILLLFALGLTTMLYSLVVSLFGAAFSINFVSPRGVFFKNNDLKTMA